MNARLLAAGDTTLKELGLTSARWQVLGAIANSDDRVTVADIARTMGLTRQGVQRTVNDLVASELVSLEENPRHRRAKIVALTPSGYETHLAALNVWREQWTVAMEEILDDDEMTETTSRLRRLRGLLQNKTRRPLV
ncbi:MarR family winged helix-turn-helix transcriptional regulator [Arthrobacter sp. SD76]|uniref:MarR family winged helix-turn-helix transcriptional regulator n=1 Tax=Arthrobacter sp. SD76 TaxID=3415007 RepID=UPI003C788B05